MVKISLYIIVFLFALWAMEGLDLNKLFKQNKVIQARSIYLILAMSMSYLVTNFVYDFITQI